MTFVRRELHIFLTAVMFYTRLPCPAWVDHAPEYLNKATGYFPLMGWLAGGLAAAVLYLGSLILPLGVAVFLAILATVWLTGAFHEDGLADICDGFGGGWTQQQILEIMKDSRVGTFGIIGLGIALGLKIVSLAGLPVELALYTLVAGHTLSRGMAIAFVGILPYASADATSKSKPVAKGNGPGRWTFVVLTALLPMAAIIWRFPDLAWWWLPIPLIAVQVYLGRLFRKWIGGYTGDCLGATQQILETLFYLTVLALWTST
jgi:adenosylcobinamide-GDP ribazoletransferase